MLYFFLALALMLIWLKLTGQIRMHWLWVISPLWGPPAAFVAWVMILRAFA